MLCKHFAPEIATPPTLSFPPSLSLKRFTALFLPLKRASRAQRISLAVSGSRHNAGPRVHAEAEASRLRDTRGARSPQRGVDPVSRVALPGKGARSPLRKTRPLLRPQFTVAAGV